jgi:hypothetical protein
MTALRRHGYDGVLAIEYVSGFDRTFENTMALKQLMIECGAHPQASLK